MLIVYNPLCVYVRLYQCLSLIAFRSDVKKAANEQRKKPFKTQRRTEGDKLQPDGG